MVFSLVQQNLRCGGEGLLLDRPAIVAPGCRCAPGVRRVACVNLLGLQAGADRLYTDPGSGVSDRVCTVAGWRFASKSRRGSQPDLGTYPDRSRGCSLGGVSRICGVGWNQPK